MRRWEGDEEGCLASYTSFLAPDNFLFPRRHTGPRQKLVLRCVRKDGGRVTKRAPERNFFWGVSVRLSKFAFLNPFTF